MSGSVATSDPPTQPYLMNHLQQPRLQRQPSHQRPIRHDGRKGRSQMTSCAEATYFLKNCPKTELEGDYNGVPSEGRWYRRRCAIAIKSIALRARWTRTAVRFDAQSTRECRFFRPRFTPRLRRGRAQGAVSAERVAGLAASRPARLSGRFSASVRANSACRFLNLPPARQAHSRSAWSSILIPSDPSSSGNASSPLSSAHSARRPLCLDTGPGWST